MNRILIVTDAWQPQINGVVRTLERLIEELIRLDNKVSLLAPSEFPTVPCPTYPEIRLALAWPAQLMRRLAAEQPDFVHIATEGPLGFAARSWCMRRKIGFTTSYHTRFPEYLAARAPIPARWTYAWLRRFHNAGQGCMVATPSLQGELAARGFRNLMLWSRGVDADRFRPRPEARDLPLPRPIFLYVGRIAPEKNVGVFLDLDLPGSKLVVGVGPQLAAFRARYPGVHFLGARVGEELARIYAAADVFVFPSQTDTFGVVLLEALASGLPIAALPVPGPRGDR